MMPILVAERFTPAALTERHAAGISLATPTTLFGRRVGAAIVSLLDYFRKSTIVSVTNSGCSSCMKWPLFSTLTAVKLVDCDPTIALTHS
jgi:hypothetical protein